MLINYYLLLIVDLENPYINVCFFILIEFINMINYNQ